VHLTWGMPVTYRIRFIFISNLLSRYYYHNSQRRNQKLQESKVPFFVSSCLPVSTYSLIQGLNHVEHSPGTLPGKQEVQATPWRAYHATDMSALWANEHGIIVMIRFLCTSQIRCVNIIKTISLCSTGLQQVLPSILVLRKDNKLALISFPTCWSKSLLSLLCKQERGRLPGLPLRKVVCGGMGTAGLAGMWYSVVQLWTSHLYPLALDFSLSN
jgi:hypothetical protein